MELMDHGLLYDILRNETVPLENDILLRMLQDISNGMRFLHSTVISRLKTYLSKDPFRANVADFGLYGNQRVHRVICTGWRPNCSVGKAQTPQLQMCSRSASLCVTLLSKRALRRSGRSREDNPQPIGEQSLQ